LVSKWLLLWAIPTYICFSISYDESCIFVFTKCLQKIHMFSFHSLRSFLFSITYQSWIDKQCKILYPIWPRGKGCLSFGIMLIQLFSTKRRRFSTYYKCKSKIFGIQLKLSTKWRHFPVRYFCNMPFAQITEHRKQHFRLCILPEPACHQNDFRRKLKRIKFMQIICNMLFIELTKLFDLTKWLETFVFVE
jgi:hypothetical protein